MKWKAVYHFKKNFDIKAENFYEMFKYAMSESSIIINNGTVQPINGILKLISHEPETMRSLFSMLYEDDGGDLDKRQDRIEKFKPIKILKPNTNYARESGKRTIIYLT